MIERKFQQSVDLEELIKTIETQIKSWTFWHSEVSKIQTPRMRSYGLKPSKKECHCGKYKARSTKGLINSDCANCGGKKPQTRYRSSKKLK